jgi:VWFA-related protein
MDRVRPTDRVAVFLFGSDVRRVQDFTPGGRDLDDSVWDASAKGITKMYDAVTEASKQLAERPEQRRAILLLSDGADFGSGESYDDAVQAAQAAGVTVFGIDLAPIDQSGSMSRSDELRARGILTGFSDKTGGRFFATKSNGTGLNEAFEQIVDELGHQYTLGYSPTNLKHDGKWRAIAVTSGQPGLRIRARSGYRAPAQ